MPLNPSDDYDSYDDFFRHERLGVNSSLLSAFDEDPEKAARSVQLSDASGVPSNVINLDQEAFERQHKAALATDLVSRDDFLRSYIASDAMAAKLSHDDLGALSEAGDKISGVVAYDAPLAARALARYLVAGFPEAWQGMKEGFGEGPVLGERVGEKGERIPGYWERVGVEKAKHDPIGTGLGYLELGAGELMFRTLSALTRGGTEMLAARTRQIGNAIGLNGDLLARDLAGMAEAEAMGMSGRHSLASPDMVGLYRGAIQAVEKDLAAGKMPKTGVHPLIDSMYKAQATLDAKALDDAVGAMGRTATKERSPEYAARFAELPADGARIRIDANAIDRLYGGGDPHPDDSLLGFIPNLKERLDATVGSGGYIDVPLKDYLAHIDPEVHKEIRDDILIRDHGFTVNEANEVPDFKPPKVEAPKEGEEQLELPLDRPTGAYTIDHPVQALRGHAGLEPMFHVGDRKLTLEKRKADDPTLRSAAERFRSPNADEFRLFDERGKKVGYLEVIPSKDGTQLYVENVGSFESLGFGPNSFGPALTRSLIRQLKEHYPNLKEIGGFRISGAREKAGTTGPATIKVEAGEPFTAEQHDGLKSLLSQNWEEVGQGVHALFNQEGKGLAADSPMGQLVMQELDRLLPSEIGIDVAHGIYHAEGGLIRGGFLPNLRQVIVSLTNKDPLGTARHESIHALRNMQMFTDAEWKTLDAAVDKQGWMEKFDVEHRWQDFKLSRDQLREEAIAEAYMDWASGGRQPPEVHTLFERIKQFLINLRERIGELFGHDFKTWDEIFEKVDSGEIGAREPVGEEPPLDLIDREDMGLQAAMGPKAANDPDAFGKQKFKSHEAAVRDQKIRKLVDENTHVGDYNYWQKIAEKENIGGKLTKTPNGYFAAKKYSEGGKTTMLIDPDGLRTVYKNGERMVRERHRDVMQPQAPPKEPTEAPAPEKIKSPFAKGRDIGLRQDIYQRYLRLIQKRHEADLQHDFESAYETERRKQTREWRENAAAIREQVEAEIDQKPNIALDKLFAERGGELKIDPMSISEAQRELLPKEYLRRTNSIAADELASYFGYPSGDAMVEHLAGVAQERKASGLSHREFTKKLVDDEVSRRMEAQYGWLEKNVLEDAKDHALSQNQIDILHEETLLLAEQAKQSLPLTRGALLSELRRSFNDTPVESISSDVWAKAAGKAGKEAEEALLKGDVGEAFKAKQRQHNATVQAKWAHEYEKARGQLDKTAKRFGKTEAPKSVEPEFVNHIQDQLRRAGYSGRRSWDNIKEDLAGQNITQFAEDHLAGSYGLRDLPVPDFIVEKPEWQKPVDKLTHGEFLQFKGMIDSLVKNGRDMRKFGKADEAVQLEEALDTAIGQVQTFEAGPLETRGKPGLIRTFLARSTAMPTVLNRFDRGNPRGFFNRLMHRFSAADNEASALEREIVGAWRELGDYGDLSKKITPPPMMEGWKYTTFTRGNLLALLQNAGNKSNWIKVAKGWGADPDELFQWLVANTTKEDWARAQAMGNKIFNRIVREADRVELNTNGYSLDKLPLEPMEIEHPKVGEREAETQTYAGWYHPLIPDQIWYADKQKVRGGAYDDSNFGHIMTSNGYTRSRTKAIYPVDLSFGMLPSRLAQMIHDITHREVILDAQKIMKNPRFLNAVTEHYGKEYSDLMVPFLRDMAGQQAMPSANWARMESTSEWLRGNAMSTYIGFNPSTPMKHAPTAFFMSLRAGGLDFLNAYKQQWLGERAIDGNNWKDYAMAHSEELQRRERHWQETFGGNTLRLDKDLSIRERMIQAGQWMVAKSDMFSARALWIGEFQKALRDDPNIRDAIDLANASVRRQHGSTAWSNKPEIVRQSGQLHGWMTSVYGFMGERFQRMVETTQKLNDTYHLMADGEFKQAARQTPGLMADYLTYMVSVGLWEEAATYALSGDHKSAGMRLFDIAFGNVASSLVYIRDMYHAMQTGQAPGIGLLPSAISDLQAPIRDLAKGTGAFNREHAGKTVRDMMTAIGIATGALPKQLGNIVQFGIDYENRQARPKDAADTLRGLARGHIPKEKAR